MLHPFALTCVCVWVSFSLPPSLPLSMCTCTPQLAGDVPGVLLVAKVVEPVYGSKEFLSFIAIINLVTSLCTFVAVYITYAATSYGILLYAHSTHTQNCGCPTQDHEGVLELLLPSGALFLFEAWRAGLGPGGGGGVMSNSCGSDLNIVVEATFRGLLRVLMAIPNG